MATETVNDIYGGNFLTAKDIEGSETVKIKTATVEEVGEKRKIVLTFEDTIDKKFPLNSTNAKRCVKLLGDDYTKWVGQSITIIKTMVEFSGKDVDALRIKLDE